MEYLLRTRTLLASQDHHHSAVAKANLIDSAFVTNDILDGIQRKLITKPLRSGNTVSSMHKKVIGKKANPKSGLNKRTYPCPRPTSIEHK